MVTKIDWHPIFISKLCEIEVWLNQFWPAKKVMHVCRHCIFYPLQLGSPFPNYAWTLRPKASLEPNQILNLLDKCKNGK